MGVGGGICGRAGRGWGCRMGSWGRSGVRVCYGSVLLAVPYYIYSNYILPFRRYIERHSYHKRIVLNPHEVVFLFRVFIVN